MELTAAQVREAVVEDAAEIDPGIQIGTPQYDLVCDTWYVPMRRVADVVSLAPLTRKLCEDRFGPRARQAEWEAKLRHSAREVTPGQKLPGE
ncbi:MAG TPA: hypothetical protein VGN26_01560 [Armatimonadota bacterium]